MDFPKVSVNILGFNEKSELVEAISSVLKQDYPNFEVTYIDNASADGSEAFVREKFPNINVLQTGENRHYGPGHNFGLRNTESELVWFLNSDLKIEPNYLSECVKAILQDDKIAGCAGKMLRPEKNSEGKYIIDGCGLTINRTRVVRDRGQWEIDNGQYNSPQEVFAICGAGPVYRRKALDDIAINGEIMDEDITAFFDDSDMGWRLRHQGWKIWYQPTAVLYHNRGAGQSQGGYKDLFGFIKFRKGISLKTKQYSWKNHIYIVIKNDFGKTLRRDWVRFLLREIAMLGYILLFEIKTLKILPTVFIQLPRIFRKRKIIKSRSVLGANNIDKFIVQSTSL